MPKKITLTLLLTLSFVALPAMAEESIFGSLEAKKTELQNKLRENQQKFEMTRDRLKDLASSTNTRSDETKNRVADFRADIAKQRSSVAERVFLANIERLEKLVERVESRLAKLDEAEASQIAEAEGFVALAKAKIVEAQEHIGSLDDIEISNSETFEFVKETIKATREALVEAKQNLMQAVRVMRGLGNTERE